MIEKSKKYKGMSDAEKRGFDLLQKLDEFTQTEDSI